jgi:magnesium-transporting ATPase (P-type)
MIQVADIGIGVSGQEGMQVSRYYVFRYHDRDLPIEDSLLYGKISVVK